MNYYIRIVILLLTTALPVIIGGFHFRMLNKPGRLFYYLCVLSLLTEAIAFYAAMRFRNNIAVYNVSNIFQMFIICLYFNYAANGLGKRHIGLLLGALSVIIGVLNIIFFQSIFEIADYFLLYQSLVIIALCITALWPRLWLYYKASATGQTDFWFIIILGLNSAVTYFLFSLIKFYTPRSPALALDFTWGVYLTSLLSSLAIAAIFLRYPKLSRHV